MNKDHTLSNQRKPYITLNTYNTNMITIVKPIPYLHTTAKNETAYTIITSVSRIQFIVIGKGTLPCTADIMPS